MSDQVSPPRRARWVRWCLWALAVLSVAALTSSAAPAPAPAHPAVRAMGRVLPEPPLPPGIADPFVVLQMNLCNSGMAECYRAGRSITEAAQKIAEHPPALVTLQEVCYDDLYSPDGWGTLARAMADLYGGAHVAVDFVPALDRETRTGYRCVDGEPYGVALMYHDDGRGRHFGWYTAQDNSDETRAWTCATVIPGRLTACTTHLSTVAAVAARQCRELMDVLTSSWVMPEVVIGGDFNLRAAPGPDDVRTCAQSRGYTVHGDGIVQQVLFSPGIQWVRGANEGMRFTDHPLLYEVLGV